MNWTRTWEVSWNTTNFSVLVYAVGVSDRSSDTRTAMATSHIIIAIWIRVQLVPVHVIEISSVQTYRNYEFGDPRPDIVHPLCWLFEKRHAIQASINKSAIMHSPMKNHAGSVKGFQIILHLNWWSNNSNLVFQQFNGTYRTSFSGLGTASHLIFPVLLEEAQYVPAIHLYPSLVVESMRYIREWKVQDGPPHTKYEPRRDPLISFTISKNAPSSEFEWAVHREGSCRSNDCRNSGPFMNTNWTGG